MLHDGQSLAAPAVEVAGFGNENTRGHGAGYQDRWVAGSGAAGAWLAVADGIGGGPAGKEAAQVAVGLAQVVLGAGELTEAGLYQLFDSAFVALRPWWVQERGGGTTLTVAAISRAGLLMGAVGDSPAYVDFGAGFELVTKPKRSHRHCCIERSRGCLAVNLAARRRSTSAGRLLCVDFCGPDSAVWDLSRGADRKICCAGLIRWLNATVPDRHPRRMHPRRHPQGRAHRTQRRRRHVVWTPTELGVGTHNDR